MRIYLLALVINPLVLSAQYLPDLKIPKTEPTYYESLQAKTITETTSDFQLKGPVKSVCEIIRAQKADHTDSSAYLKAEYLFSEKGNLLNFLEDSASSLFRGDQQINRILNRYDPSGEHLLESIRFTNRWQKTKKVLRFNAEGFIEQETHTCQQCESGSHRNDPYYDSIFDYTLVYQWSPDFDSVALKYRYVKPTSPYQRESDKMHSFVRERKKNQSKGDTRFIADLAPDYFQFQTNEIKRDQHNRIIEWIVWDHTIKSSFNVHHKSEYAYNEKDELTEIRHFSTFRSNSYDEFQLVLKVAIRYVAYDAYDNWIEREVVIDPENYGYNLPRKVYRYKRELVYY